MDLVVGIVAAVAGGIALWAFMMKQAAQTELDAAKARALELEAAAKKADDRAKELEKKVERSRGDRDLADTSDKKQKARVGELEDQIRALKATLERTAGREKAEEKARAMEREVERLSGEVEKARAQAKAAAQELDQARAQAQQQAPVVQMEARPKKRDEEAPREPPRSRDGVDPAYRERVEQLVERYREIRERCMRSEAEMRTAWRHAEHNRRAYVITQLHLDLAQDQLYTLEHGQPPGTRKPRLERAIGQGPIAAMPPSPVATDAEALAGEETSSDEPALPLSSQTQPTLEDAELAAEAAELAERANSRAA